MKLDISLFQDIQVLMSVISQTYQGAKVSSYEAYSFTSLDLGGGDFSNMPSGDNVVYMGYLKRGAAAGVAVPFQVGVRGTNFEFIGDQDSTPVIFDEVIADDVANDTLTSPLQFWGWRFTVMGSSTAAVQLGDTVNPFGYANVLAMLIVSPDSFDTTANADGFVAGDDTLYAIGYIDPRPGYSDIRLVLFDSNGVNPDFDGDLLAVGAAGPYRLTMPTGWTELLSGNYDRLAIVTDNGDVITDLPLPSYNVKTQPWYLSGGVQVPGVDLPRPVVWETNTSPGSDGLHIVNCANVALSIATAPIGYVKGYDGGGVFLGRDATVTTNAAALNPIISPDGSAASVFIGHDNGFAAAGDDSYWVPAVPQLILNFGQSNEIVCSLVGLFEDITPGAIISQLFRTA